MRRFAGRRIRNIAILICLAAGFVFLDRLLRLTFRDAAYVNGWSLMALVVLLALYNLLKKIPYFPLGSSSAWLQLHIYAGLLSIVIFGLHVGLRFTNGVFESVLAVVFLLVSGSGLFGVIISRMFARRLTARGDEILFDRIPRKLGVLRRAAENVVQQCLEETSSTLLPEFYVVRLEPFFATHRNLGHHLVHSSRPQKAIVAEIHAQLRYLDEAESEYLAKIEDLVAQKDGLDYQYAHQSLLKYWLFVHVPLTYALLVLALLHLILVHAF